MQITISDDTLTGVRNHALMIEVPERIHTVKELIEQRVIQEVERYNQRVTERFHGLVEPTDAEFKLNAYAHKKVKSIDPEKQVYVALDAFQKNRFFLFIDDEQYDDLQSTFMPRPDMHVSFIKLVQLVGG